MWSRLHPLSHKVNTIYCVITVPADTATAAEPITPTPQRSKWKKPGDENILYLYIHCIATPHSPSLQLARKSATHKKLLNVTDEKGWQEEGEGEEEEDDVSELQRRVHTAKLPAHARKAALKEIKVCQHNSPPLVHLLRPLLSPAAAQDTSCTLSRARCVEVSECVTVFC